ncbi:MarR family winged helix-turn-helix transcriptional regulator [Actinomadura litoris]|nr:MarR family winged helix-turn-helix transcriptional regulator [Actinomadura litoris]
MTTEPRGDIAFDGTPTSGDDTSSRPSTSADDPSGGSSDGPSLRRLMAATQEVALAAVALNSAGAALMGMSPSDSFCLWHVTEATQDEPVTSGRLAELTGLTTGAITGVVDRLEAAGFVTRERDPRDRRRQLIRPVPEKIAELYRLFEPLDETYEGLRLALSPRDREVILDYLRTVSGIMRAHVTVLREAHRRSKAPGRPRRTD